MLLINAMSPKRAEEHENEIEGSKGAGSKEQIKGSLPWPGSGGELGNEKIASAPVGRPSALQRSFKTKITIWRKKGSK